jgi:import inner membrane translocase subunit TIM23
VLTMSDMDSLVSQIPLDPFITLGLITFTCGGIGWLMGPILGTGIFNVRNRKFRQQMDEKEKEFYRRVKRYRVDPSASSMANPVPGEFELSFIGKWRAVWDLRLPGLRRMTKTDWCVADYYGEKIASVAGYRQWLKDQRAFNKKRQTYV